MTKAKALKAPYPYFGGKSRVASTVWAALGDVKNYVEPFFGSGAVLLARPSEPHIESVNDIDCFVANFWRAIQADPEGVARVVDWPVNEADLHARHRWLVNQDEWRERMKVDPDHFDVKVAGWWAWGLCSWIGSGWCSAADKPAGAPEDGVDLPHLGNAGRGVNRQLPHLGNAGQGLHRKLPHLGDAGGPVSEWLGELSVRLRRVRVACGDWTRVLGDSVTWRHGVTGVFLDPPYDDGEVEYAAGGRGVSSAVREWAIANGDNKKMRIALCGYDGEHKMPEAWTEHAWKAHGGYGSQRTDGENENAHRERIWFSPHCLPLEKKQPSLFDLTGT